MKNPILHTINGDKEIDRDVATYINRLEIENQNLKKEIISLKLKVFNLEFRLNRGWIYRIFFG